VLRIIAGAHRGRIIRAPAGRGTRPTSDRVRESLLGTLSSMTEITGIRFLDLYAGSGAVGLEAVSRGAAVATFVERDHGALQVIRRNIAALGEAESCRIEPVTVRRYLRRPEPVPADIVFLDPPYAEAVDDDVRLLAAGGWLAPGGVVVVERSVRNPAVSWPSSLSVDRVHRYGEVVVEYATGLPHPAAD